MTYERLGAEPLDYAPCRYGSCKILFRGPGRQPSGRYAVFLGGSETYGRFLESPFPTLVEQATGLAAVNLGCVNAGPDVYLAEPALMDIIGAASATVIQVPGAQNLSNRFYAVHPRRNDRFLGASRFLQQVYPGVDFTEIHYTGHLLATLRTASRDRFDLIVSELRAAWVARMHRLILQAGGSVVLLWLSARRPGDRNDVLSHGAEPVFVTNGMLAELPPHRRVEIVASPSEIRSGRAGLHVSPRDAAAAADMLGAAVHARATRALVPILRDV